MMIDDLSTRPIILADYILENNSTIRATAKEFNIPKSTVHHDLAVKLKYLDYSLYKQVKKLLIENFSIKHIHGGESTKHKYEQLRKEINKNEETEMLLNL